MVTHKNVWIAADCKHATNEPNLGKLKLDTTKTQPPSDIPSKMCSTRCSLSFLAFKVISPCSKLLGKNWQYNCRNNSPFTLPFSYIRLQARYCCFSAFALRPGLQMLLPNALPREVEQ